MAHIIKMLPMRTVITAGLSLFLCFVAIAFLVYGQSIHYSFIGWDDYAFFVDDPAVQQLTLNNLFIIFSEPRLSVWYPLARFSHAVDMFWFGADPAAARMVNIVLHSLNAWLVFGVCLIALCRYNKSGVSQPILWSASMAAFFFLVHPQHTEAVVWISQRKELLSAFFFFLAVLVYLLTQEKKNALWSCVIFFIGLLAMLAKPMSVTLPLVLTLIDQLLCRENSGHHRFSALLVSLKHQLPLFVVALLIGLMTLYSHDNVGALSLNLYYSFMIRVELSLFNFLETLFNIFWFGGLSPARDMPAFINGSLFTLLALLFVCVFIAWGLYWLGRKFTGVWLLMMVFVMHFPVSGITLFGTYASGDRYAYISTAPVYVGLSLLLSNAFANRLLISILGTIVVILICGIASIRQLSMWENDFALWKRVVERHPANAMSLYYLGDQYRKKGNFEAAIYYMDRAVKLGPVFDGYPTYAAFSEMAEMYKKMRMPTKALEVYRASIPYYGERADIFVAIGILETVVGNREGAHAAFSKAYTLDRRIKNTLHQQLPQIHDPLRRQILGDWLALIERADP